MSYIPVQWPFTQQLMEVEGFEQNSYLINDEKGLEDFGPSAYFIKMEWLNTIDLQADSIKEN